MQVTLEPHVPRARCHRCGSVEIAGVCHHCGQPMCDRHLGLRPTRLSRLFDREYDYISGPPDALHCARCEHRLYPQRPWLLAVGLPLLLACIVVGVLGWRLDWTAAWPGVSRWLSDWAVPAALGLFALGGLALIAAMRSGTWCGGGPAALPLTARFDQVGIEEILPLKIDLDANGAYTVRQEPAPHLTLKGHATVSARERDRSAAAYRRARLLDANAALDCHLGFVVLNGPAALQWKTGPLGSTSPPGVLPLIVPQRDLKDVGANSNLSGYHIERTANLVKIPAEANRLVSLVPSLPANTDNRVISVEIQWAAPPPTHPHLKIERIDYVELYLPADWGPTPRVSGAPTKNRLLDDGNGNCKERLIRWEQIALTPQESTERRHTLYVTFTQPIVETPKPDANPSEPEPPPPLIGVKVQVAFRPYLSGINGIAFYTPYGHPLNNVDCHRVTHVVVDANLRLDSLRTRQTQPLPHETIEPNIPPPNGSYALVPPDATTVDALVAKLTESHFYVKRVIESPPRTSHQANTVTRYWDIAGRVHEGVYPIDFHLIVTGDETLSLKDFKTSGQTRATLTVQGEAQGQLLHGQAQRKAMDAVVSKAFYGIFDVVRKRLDELVEERRHELGMH